MIRKEDPSKGLTFEAIASSKMSVVLTLMITW